MRFFTLNESNQIDGVTSPEELMDWMNENITYELVDDEYSNSNGIPTKTAEEVLKTGKGHCAEQSYLEKEILDGLGYESFFAMVKENNSEKEYGAEGSSHLFLVYKDEDARYCWFEHSMQHARGIHKYDTLYELLKDVAQQWWRYDENSDILEVRFIDKPITGVDNWGLAKECYKYPVEYTFDISNNVMEEDVPLDAEWDFDNKKILGESLSTKIARRDNPNDFSPFGYKVDFYDGDLHIGEGSVCGIKDDNAFLYDFEVYPEYRGKGYSKEMLQFMIDKYDLKQLYVQQDNTVAVNLYKKLGFKVDGEVEDNGKPAYDMIRESYKMRFTLTEGKNLEQTVQQYIDKYRKIVPAATDEMHRAQVIGIIQIDPTYKEGTHLTGDYAIWLLNMAIKNKWDVLDTRYHCEKVLTDFIDKKSLLKNKDINSYKSPEDLAQALSEVELTDRQKERRARNATAMTKKVLETENWDVYMALNWEGALTLGKGTSWCTADSENASWYIRYVADIWWDGDAGAVEVKDLTKEGLTLQDIASAMQNDDLTLEQIYDEYSDRAVFAYWDGSGWLYNPYEVEDDSDVHNKLYVFINKHSGLKYQFCISSTQVDFEEDLNDAITFCNQSDHHVDFRDFIGYYEKELREFWMGVLGYSMQELFSIDPDEEDDLEESLSTNKMRFNLVEAKADTQRLISWAGEDLANRFIAIKDRLKSPENDLYYWIKNGSLEDFEKVITNIENSKSNTQLKADASDGAELVSENSHWKVYHITTFEASQKYGRDTKWCITGINGYGDKYWNDYTDDGIKFYFFISKVDYDDRGTDSKFALALQSDYTWELYNQKDDLVYNLPDTKGLYIDGISVKKLIRGDIVRCVECGDIIDKDEAYFSPNNEHICELCFSTKYDFCDNCDELFEIDSLNHIDDNKYCDYCTDYCPNCGAGALYSDIEDGMCPSCRDEEEIDESYKSNRMRFTLTEDIAAVQKNFPNIDDETFRHLIALDPTFNPNRDSVGTYGKWILTLYNKGEIKDEDWENVTQMLDVWETNKKRFTNRDIGQFKTLKQLEDALLDMPDLELSHRQKVRQNQKARRGVNLGTDAELVFDGNDWEVWIPKTYAASCKLGQHTSWCTASTEDEHYFKNYDSQGPLYILIDKENDKHKYQFHFETHSFMDRDDNEISIVEFLNTTGSELSEFFYEKLFDDWGLIPGLKMDDTIEVEFTKSQIEALLNVVSGGWNNVPGDTCFEMIYNADDYIDGFYYDTFYELMLGASIDCLSEANKDRIKKLTGLTDLTNSKILDYDGFLIEAFIDAIKGAYNESATYNVQTEAVLALEDAASAVKGIRADFDGSGLIVKGKLSSFVELYSEYYEFDDETAYCCDDNLSKAVGTCLIRNYDFHRPRGDEWGELEDDLFNEYLENSLFEWFGDGEEQ
jgi:ribosomal protein S18 acetylase RimI-like enzyme